MPTRAMTRVFGDDVLQSAGVFSGERKLFAIIPARNVGRIKHQKYKIDQIARAEEVNVEFFRRMRREHIQFFGDPSPELERKFDAYLSRGPPPV